MPFWTLRRAFGAAAVLALSLAVGWAAVVLAVAVTAARDQATTADAIVVLGAAQYNGRPSPVFRSRLDHAAALYQRGYAPRSEEHTSELQSQSNLVCRLLLEKKKAPPLPRVPRAQP